MEYNNNKKLKWKIKLIFQQGKKQVKTNISIKLPKIFKIYLNCLNVNI